MDENLRVMKPDNSIPSCAGFSGHIGTTLQNQGLSVCIGKF
jgi:hypothetical protein